MLYLKLIIILYFLPNASKLSTVAVENKYFFYKASSMNVSTAFVQYFSKINNKKNKLRSLLMSF